MVAINTSKVFAQTAQKLAPRDAQALYTVQSAVNALGGLPSLLAVRDVITSGSCAFSSTSESTQTGASDFVWTIAGREFRYDSTSQGSTNSLVSGHGRPARGGGSSQIQKVKLTTAQATRPYHLPGFVLAETLSNQRLGLNYVGKVSTANATTIEVQVLDYKYGFGTPSLLQTWFFDPNSAVPLEVDYSFPGELAASYAAPVKELLGDYQMQAGLLLPSRITAEYPGFVTLCTTSRTTFNSHPAPSTFDLLPGGAY